MRNFLFGGIAAAALLAVSAPAYADAYSFTSTSMNNPLVVHIVPTNEDVFMAPMDFTGLDLTTGKVVSLEEFCLDVTHNITKGTQNPALQYTGAPVTTSSSFGGNPSFTANQLGRISYLINVAAPHFAPGSLDLKYIQGGIWDDILGGIGNVTSSDATVQSGIDFYGSLANTSNLQINGIFSVPNAAGVYTQGFGGPSVPEPATWAMMIAGFGLAGVMLRRRRQHALIA